MKKWLLLFLLCPQLAYAQVNTSLLGGGFAKKNPNTIVSLSAKAFTVGQSGPTNPVLQVDDSTAGQTNGISIKGGNNSATTITEIGSTTSTSTGININDKSGGIIGLAGGVAQFTDGSTGGDVTLAPKAVAFASGVGFTFTEGADNNLTASTEVPAVKWLMGSRQWATGALALNRDFLITGDVYKFVGASTITNGATLGFTLPGCGTNATCTTLSGIYHASSALTATGTISTSYGVNIAADTGATTNYSGSFTGGNGFVTDGIISKGTTFTVSGCSATSPVGGAAAGSFSSGTTGACTATVTIAGATGMTAPNGWSCWSSDQTTGNLFRQTSSTTTTATLSGTTVSGDSVTFGCLGY